MSTSELERFAERMLNAQGRSHYGDGIMVERRIVLSLIAEVREARNLPRSETHSFYLKYEKARAETDAALAEQSR